MIHGMALFAGGGGLELGINLALGDRYRCVCCVEREVYAAAVLASRMEEGWLDSAPLWDDIETFDGKPWRGKVHLISAGFPCQDVSVAGKREGLKRGNRTGLWYEVARIIGEVGPQFVFLENVRGLVNNGLADVLGSLADLGYDAEWDLFRAQDVGAPHKRERLFILAYPRRQLRPAIWSEPRTNQPLSEFHDQRRRADVADTAGKRLQRPKQVRKEYDISAFTGHEIESVGDPHRSRSQRWGLCPSERADEWPSRKTASPIFPPGPDDSEGWRKWLLKNPKHEPAVCRSTHGVAERVDRLRLCGNGVIPLQAALAFRVLMERIHSK